MISQKLVHLIETHADELCKRWLKKVRLDEDTPTYHNFPENKLVGRIENLYSHLSEWLVDETEIRAKESFRELGARKFQEGFHISEVVKALILARRTLWFFVEERGFYDTVELRQAIELSYRVNLFFDRIIIHALQGYEREADLTRRIKAHA